MDGVTALIERPPHAAGLGLEIGEAECRRDRRPRAPVYPSPAQPMRRAILHVLAMLGLGADAVAALADDEPPGIG